MLSNCTASAAAGFAQQQQPLHSISSLFTAAAVLALQQQPWHSSSSLCTASAAFAQQKQQQQQILEASAMIQKNCWRIFCEMSEMSVEYLQIICRMLAKFCKEPAECIQNIRQNSWKNACKISAEYHRTVCKLPAYYLTKMIEKSAKCLQNISKKSA